MLMLMTILVAGLPILVLGCALFIRLARLESQAVEAPAEARAAVPSPRFFAAEGIRPRPAPVSLDTLLSEIERHIRLEQAAAESFLNEPTPEALHSRTVSALVN